MTTEHPMQLGMVGLGRMGSNLVRRLMRDGHRCVVYDVNASAVASLVAEGATGANDLEDFVAQLERPRNGWLMLPAAIAGRVLDHLSSRLAGAGHFVKMVHNGIEYGMMAAIAEGLSILKHANAGKEEQETDAETTPLTDPGAYQYDINVAEVAEVWRRGSVVSSWLVDLTARALAKSPDLSEFAGHVADSGEGRWTVPAAVEGGGPAPVITGSLFQRFEARWP